MPLPPPKDGSTPFEAIPPPEMSGSPVASPVLLDDLAADLYLLTSMLTARLPLLLVARLSSSSFTSMYWPWTIREQASLILATNGSLRDALKWMIMFTILGLNGCPLGSTAFTLHISTISFKAFYLTLVFLWRHHWQANSVSCSYVRPMITWWGFLLYSSSFDPSKIDARLMKSPSLPIIALS